MTISSPRANAGIYCNRSQLVHGRICDRVVIGWLDEVCGTLIMTSCVGERLVSGHRRACISRQGDPEAQRLEIDTGHHGVVSSLETLGRGALVVSSGAQEPRGRPRLIGILQRSA